MNLEKEDEEARRQRASRKKSTVDLEEKEIRKERKLTRKRVSATMSSKF